ncbi:DUF4363 family protein [Lentibacillus saliphilus]|uniref:DUF4363 family protein n=1 Tax=Lentibacillus saliphilus TaxID=2737028 RepID=UPI001C30F52B|nr:DUF4363 family protein [Lentibacillus saliphilus]
MKKFMLYVVPSAMLFLFVVVMNSGSMLKKPYGQDDRVYEAVKQLETHVKEERWEHAEKDIQYIERAWKKVVNRIQFSVEKDNMEEISQTISHMKGQVYIRDDQAIFEHIYYYYDLWDRLAK